jgi:hypothetical protein
MEIFFSSSGNTAVFDTEGEQIPELQKSYILMFAEFLEKDYGIDPLKLTFTMPDGRKAHLFSTDSGYNWRLK